MPNNAKQSTGTSKPSAKPSSVSSSNRTTTPSASSSNTLPQSSSPPTTNGVLQILLQQNFNRYQNVTPVQTFVPNSTTNGEPATLSGVDKKVSRVLPNQEVVMIAQNKNLQSKHGFA